MSWLTWALLSAFFAAITAILAKVGVQEISSNLATAIRTTVVLVLAWAVAWATMPSSAISGISRRALLFLVLSGLATGLSWLCYFRALQMAPVSKVAPLDKLSLPLAILLATVFLGERSSSREWAGIGLMVCGTLVLAWK